MMTPEQIEQLTARKLADSALRTAGYHSAPADRETVAITFLLAAVELLTPELAYCAYLDAKRKLHEGCAI